ncbi:hypothetical protein niasHS_017359 [Heterodera schachtii]|uniref:Uncharacterized protein n=1 Tax=Heterodera schachtii TaxID=97005 RepID=A0ABD2I6M9_HETSC
MISKLNLLFAILFIGISFGLATDQNAGNDLKKLGQSTINALTSAANLGIRAATTIAPVVRDQVIPGAVNCTKTVVSALPTVANATKNMVNNYAAPAATNAAPVIAGAAVAVKENVAKPIYNHGVRPTFEVAGNAMANLPEWQKQRKAGTNSSRRNSTGSSGNKSVCMLACFGKGKTSP